jgi:arabinan endo-1,5-alpha-L-arabinosidase
VTDSEGNEWMLYHSYDRHTPSKGRYLMIDRIVWENDWPVIAGNSPSTEAEAPVCK